MKLTVDASRLGLTIITLCSGVTVVDLRWKGECRVVFPIGREKWRYPQMEFCPEKHQQLHRAGFGYNICSMQDQ